MCMAIFNIGWGYPGSYSAYLIRFALIVITRISEYIRWALYERGIALFIRNTEIKKFLGENMIYRIYLSHFTIFKQSIWWVDKFRVDKQT